MRLPSEVEEFERQRARMLSARVPEALSPEPAATGTELLTVMLLLSIFVPALLVLLLIYFACLPIAWGAGLVGDLWRFLRPRPGRDALKWTGPPPAPGKRGKAAGGRF